MKPIEYKQTDPRWSKTPYAAEGEKATIGSAGCGPTCMAMVIATLVNAKVTPLDTVAWSLKNKFKAFNQGTYYTYFVPQGAEYGLDVVRVNADNAKQSKNAKTYQDMVSQAIADGDMVICCMGPGHWTKGGHYILLYGTEGMNALISDPASSAANRAKAPLSKLFAEAKYYWIVRTPKKKNLDLHVMANGKLIRDGFIKDSAGIVPVRAVAEAFGATVTWNEKGRYVAVNGNMITTTNIDGVAYAPARKLAEVLKVKVDWDATTFTITFKKG